VAGDERSNCETGLALHRVNRWEAAGEPSMASSNRRIPTVQWHEGWIQKLPQLLTQHGAIFAEREDMAVSQELDQIIAQEGIGGPSSFGGTEMPAPESRGRRAAIRSVAVSALLLSLAYLIWRTMFTVNLDVWWLSVPVLLLEIHAFVSLAFFAFSLWDLDATPPAGRVLAAPGRIAVLIPTYDEAAEVLLPTVAAAVALRPAHETWVLDDGDRDDIRALAEDLGARYLARPDNTHAKAGNINHALTCIDADFVAVLDADHVARPELLTNTLGYFADPKVAVVQTPQEFYNLDSFEHEEVVSRGRRRSARRLYNEQALFYRAIQPGKNRWGAAFWCGTGAVVRVTALEEVGGISTESITEDIHTTIRLHHIGWKSIYHNEVLARGLAAADAAQYQVQRLRWGAGAMQVLRKDNPLFKSGLSPTQRIAYAATLLGWFDSWRSLGYLVVPIAAVVTGAVPITAKPVVFAAAFGTTFIAQRIALSALARGYAPPFLSTVFDVVRMPANLSATLRIFKAKNLSFSVTPKGRLGDERSRQGTPLLLVVLMVASAAAAGVFGATLLGLTPLHYGVPEAAIAAGCWMALNAYVVARAISRIRSDRFASERRASVRFDISLDGTLDGLPCKIADVSLTGARVELDSVIGENLKPESATRNLELSILGSDLCMRVIVRSRRESAGLTVLGLQFTPAQERLTAGLAQALFNAQLNPELELVA
jgi:cellulose synthase (UDP-forming)